MVMNRNGEIAILMSGKPRAREERYPIVYGARLKMKDGMRVKGGKLMAEWDPYSTPIAHRGLRHQSSSGTSMKASRCEEQFDERTGLSHEVVIETKDRQASEDLIMDDRREDAQDRAAPRRGTCSLSAYLNLADRSAT